VWRSIATVFGWTQTLAAEEILRLKGREVHVVSLLANRLLVSSLSLDVDADHNPDRPLVTPVRSKAGKSYGNAYVPSNFEEELVGAVGDSSLKRQLLSIGAGHDYCLGRVPDIVLQDGSGCWSLAPPPPMLAPERRREVVMEFCGIFNEAGLHNAENSFILVESPDPVRGFEDQSWQQLATLHLRKLLHRTESDGTVITLEADSVALGCAEYVARLAHNLPTFFDYLPQIEIVALDLVKRLLLSHC
jgi:hypothetical protein